ncbi:hypothetical protein [Enterococcus sp. DIV0660C]|uniref:hypothetical protein n=1 Tax=Enterococcus sp. DIV0660C TaxID=2230880 RepID=UPI001A8F19B6|nr:hypothetical protein [Enterococcus sp. DIV0660C]MBO0432099.1 hypothetical protein [Enterococcus sp. DIV0660C]
MLFYKVCLQENKETLPMYEQLGRTDFLIGNCPNSYAIPYSPEYFAKWLNKSQIFSIFIHDSIKQALLNNNKFYQIFSISESLKLNIIDCQFKNVELTDVLEGEDLDVEILNYVLKNRNYRLLKATFRSENNLIISIKRNGVIEIDERVLEKDTELIKNLVDILNLGCGVVL